MPANDDILWPHFAAIWPELRAVAPDFVLAGGYGLFLKQRWLRHHASIPTVVGWDQWLEPAPRATKDIDFVIRLELIASSAHQSAIHAIIERHGFEVVPKNARWQFRKHLFDGRSVLIEFHAPNPPLDRGDLRVDDRRVKPKPSLGDVGIQARRNPEADGCFIEPFEFTWDLQTIVVPSPVAWIAMKLPALCDRWNASQDPDRSPEERAFDAATAAKHARDVCRVVALTTRAEYERAPIIIRETMSRPTIENARESVVQFFGDPGSRGIRFAQSQWTPTALELIRATICLWF